MRALAQGVVAIVLTIVTSVATPGPVTAACATIDENGWLARRVGRNAETIVLGRLLEAEITEDGDNLVVDVLSVYRGEAASPLEVHGAIDIGGCRGPTAALGQRLVYTSWIDERDGPTALIFPYVPGRGWIIEHFGATASLDGLLGLLGVLPDTSMAEPEPRGGIGSGFGWSVVALFGLAGLFFLRLRTRRTD